MRRADLRQVPTVRPAQQAGLAEGLRGSAGNHFKEPLGPVVRNGDDEWLAIVRWVGYAMLNAEEAGITSKTLKLKPSPPRTRTLLVCSVLTANTAKT